jgi:hypothetical protein
LVDSTLDICYNGSNTKGDAMIQHVKDFLSAVFWTALFMIFLVGYSAQWDLVPLNDRAQRHDPANQPNCCSHCDPTAIDTLQITC